MSLITSEFSISARDLTGKSRTQAISLPRQIAMHLARKYTDHCFEEIGRFFGNRDHTTVIYAVTKIRDLGCTSDPDSETQFASSWEKANTWGFSPRRFCFAASRQGSRAPRNRE